MADNEFSIPACARAEISARGYALPPDMSAHIERWYGWYTGSDSWYEERYAGVDGKPRKRRKLSLRPARRVCREWASLIANEMGAGTDSPMANEWLAGFCEETDLFTLFQRGIERTFAMGTGAMALWFDVREDGASMRVRRYDAKMVVPLSWDEDGTTECAFCTRVAVKGKQAVQLQMHVLDGGTYHVVTKVWLDGEELPPESLGIIGDFDTQCRTPTFCVLSPAIDNTLQDASPYGVSVFEDAVDTMKVLDTAWTALYDETDLMRAVLMLPDSMIDVQRTGADGKPRAVPFGDQEQRLYRLTSSAIGEEGKPYAFAPQMRTDSICGVLTLPPAPRWATSAASARSTSSRTRTRASRPRRRSRRTTPRSCATSATTRRRWARVWAACSPRSSSAPASTAGRPSRRGRSRSASCGTTPSSRTRTPRSSR